MYIFRLFDKGAMHQAVDARLLQTGLLRVGRDPQADWVMNDPLCEISRWHCEFEAAADSLVVRCMGANGVFDGVSGQRLPTDGDIPLALPQTLHFGPYTLVADHAAQGDSPVDEGSTLILSPPLGHSIAVPTDWPDDEPARASEIGPSLLDAFCEGAGLNPSSFCAEDPEDVMRRAGAVYRQMVLGVGDLMAEREKLRGQYQLARTTIGGANNNPFKWAPTQRLAIDLLLANDRGFLSGADALAASFRDVKKHLIATFDGLRAAMRATLARFEPASVDAEAAQHASMLKSRSSACWEVACARHGDLAQQLEQGADGMLNQTFVQAYEASASRLEARGS